MPLPIVSNRPLGLLLAALLAVNATAALWVTQTLRDSREHYQKAAEANSQNLALVLDQNIPGRSIRSTWLCRPWPATWSSSCATAAASIPTAPPR